MQCNHHKPGSTQQESAKLQRHTCPISRLKKRATLPHPRVASVELAELETTHFQKCMYMPDVVCNVKERIM
jgi:hypothetical protein